MQIFHLFKVCHLAQLSLLLFRLVTCEDTFVSIHNLTPYSFSRKSVTYTGGTDNTEWSFPTSIASGTAEEGHVAYEASITGDTSNLAASVTYYVLESDNTEFGTIDIWLDVTDELKPTLRARLSGFTTSTVDEGQIFELGWESSDGKRTPFILSGGFEATDLTTFYPPDDWMQHNLDAVGCRSLRELCIPGSHDAAMSEFHRPTSIFVQDFNTETQSISILDQLRAGSRFLDIRPIIDGGHYHTGHFEINTPVGSLGANGQSMQDVIWNINNFTEHNNELIILTFSHSHNRDNDYATFDQEDWNGLMGWTNEINHLYEATSSDPLDLSKKSLNSYIGGGQPAVILLNQDGTHSLTGGKGFYNRERFPMTGTYANSNDIVKIRGDQATKMYDNRNSPQDTFFQLFWTSTTGTDPDGIIKGAREIYSQMFEASGDLDSLSGQGILRLTTSQSYPNVITTDDFRDFRIRRLTSLVIGINRLYATCS